QGTGGTSLGGNNATGVAVADSSTIQTQGITIQDPPFNGNFVVGTGNITLIGFGGNAALGGSANGVTVANFSTSNGGSILSNTGSITLNGNGGTSATGEARGVGVRASSLVESSGSGNIFFNGNGGTSAATGNNSVSGVAFGTS